MIVSVQLERDQQIDPLEQACRRNRPVEVEVVPVLELEPL